MIAAVPAGLGLSGIARSDLATHRFSLSFLGPRAAVVALCLVVDTTASSEWGRLGVAAMVTGLVVVALLVLWLSTRVLAFGDVVLVAFALLVPAWLSPRAAATTVSVTLWAAGAIAVVQRLRRGSKSVSATIALGPALMVGWLAGVMVR